MAVQTDLEVIVDNRPGAAAAVGEALGSAGINIAGACGWGSGETGTVHVLIEGDAVSARATLEQAGLQVGAQRSVYVTPCPDRPGELGRVLRNLAAADVNLVVFYLTTSGQLVVGAEDVREISALLS